jgi:hypothetical protein
MGVPRIQIAVWRSKVHASRAVLHKTWVAGRFCVLAAGELRVGICIRVADEVSGTAAGRQRSPSSLISA